MSRYVVFDSHCDTATELWHRRQSLNQTNCHVSLPRMEQYPACGQFFAFCTLGGIDTGRTCEQLLWEPYQYFMKQLEVHKDRIRLCTKGSEFDQTAVEGKCAAFLALEGAEGISCDPGRLDELREAGITMINLTWNADNALAGASKHDGPGLSAQGREFVRRAQKLGIIIDVSHISDRAFWDIMDITEAPIVASHSNLRSVCDHSRNLTEDMYRAIVQTGGTAGINLCAPFIKSEGADFDATCDHILRRLEIDPSGEHVSLGGDLDGCDELPAGFVGIQSYNALADRLLERGLDEQTIRNIYWHNTMGVMDRAVRNHQK